MTTMTMTMTTTTTDRAKRPDGGQGGRYAIGAGTTADGDTTRTTWRDHLQARLGAMPPISLRRRLVGSIALLAGLGFFGSGLTAYLVERQRIEVRVGNALAQEISEFRALAGKGVDPTTGAPFEDVERLLILALQRNVPGAHETHLGLLADVTVAPPEGAGPLHLDPGFRRQIVRATQPGYGEYTIGDERVVYAALPFIKGGETGHYVAAHYITREYEDFGGTVRSYAIAALTAWLVLILAAWLLARRILAPIHSLREDAARITGAAPGERIVVRGNDEVAALAGTLNGMLDRLQEALGAQRRMLDEAAHELRTPITVIRGHLELMDPAAPADIESTRDLAIDELDRMGGLVGDLLTLARSRRPDFLTPAVTDVGAVMLTAFEKASGLAPRRWTVDPVEHVMTFIDAQRITQALLQLASNAVGATTEHDEIAFGCGVTSRGVRLWVRDTGPGVAPADRVRIFDRFESGAVNAPGSGNGTATGTGLGLAIVRAIARAHGGSARVTAATSAGGALFLIDLPRSVIVDRPGNREGTVVRGGPTGAGLTVAHHGPSAGAPVDSPELTFDDWLDEKGFR